MPIGTARLTGNRTPSFDLRPRREPFWNSRQAFFADAILFIFGAIGSYSLNVVGALPYSEALLLPLLPALLLARGKRAFDRRYLMFYILAGCWLLGTLIADMYNGMPLYNRTKGTARVIFFILDFMALAVLLNNKSRRFLIFAMSLATLMFLGSLQFSGNFQLQWKFGLSHAFSLLALLISAHFYKSRRYWICLSITLLLAGINFRYGFRSQLVIHVVSAVLVLPIFDMGQTQSSRSRGSQNTIKVLMLLALAGGVTFAANAGIKYGAEMGLFEESDNAKFQSQSSGDYGVLVGGRPETLVAIQAIRDSPIIGHGSFPAGLKYLQLEQQIQFEHGYSDSDEPDDTEFPIIPTHSHLTMAWVESGILGGICWIYLFILVLRGVLRLTTLRPHLAPVYSYLLVNFLWDILYSPFGSVNRMRAAFFILLSYYILGSPVTKTVEAGRRFVKSKFSNRSSSRLRPVAGWSARPGFSGGRP